MLFSTAYFGPIEYYARIVQGVDIVIEQHENFVKQTYRNRCVILGPHKTQILNIPVQKVSGKQKITDVKISYTENWNELHWRSLQTAYGSSPFFEIIGPDIKALLDSKPENLFELNKQSISLVLRWLDADQKLNYTDKFAQIEDEQDYRFSISPKVKTKLDFDPYFQVFRNREQFTPNLSILDLLFNQGKLSWEYLRHVNLEPA